MLNAPIFVYTEKTKRLPLKTMTIRGDSPFYQALEEARGVESVVEDGISYIKIKNYELKEQFSDTLKLATDLSGITTVYPNAGIWGQQTIGGVTKGLPNFLTCNYTEQIKTPFSTGSSAPAPNSLVFSQSDSAVSLNSEVTASVINLGKDVTASYTSYIDGNAMQTAGSYLNNQVFLPFVSNSGAASTSYGSNTNLVPANVYVKDLYISSLTDNTYPVINSSLVLGFDLYYNGVYKTRYELVLRNAVGQNYNGIAQTLDLTTLESNLPNGLISNLISLRNVQLKNVPAGQSFAQGSFVGENISNVLILRTSGRYVSLADQLLTTQPVVQSQIFEMKDSATNGSFSSFGTLKFFNVDSTNGILVEVKLSNTREGMASANYTKLGIITGTGSTSVTLGFSLDDTSYVAAANAKFLQVRLKGLAAENSTIFTQSSVSSLVQATEQDPKNKFVYFNNFPDKFKFDLGEQVQASLPLFGPYPINSTQTIQQNTSLGTYNIDKVTQTVTAVYSDDILVKFGERQISVPIGSVTTQPLFGERQISNPAPTVTFITSTNKTTSTFTYKNTYVNLVDANSRQGNIQGVHALYRSINYIAKSQNNTSLEATPTYTPSSSATTQLNTLGGSTSNYYLVLEYTVNTQQGQNPHIQPSGCSTPYIQFIETQYGFHKNRDGTEGTDNFKKSVTVQVASNIAVLPDYTVKKRNIATFAIEQNSDPLPNRFLRYQITNVREVIYHYNPTTGITTERWAQAANINNVPTFGMWYVGNTEFALQPKTTSVETNVAGDVQRVIFPAFKFDNFEGTSILNLNQREFDAVLVVKFLTTGGAQTGSTVRRTFTTGNNKEIIIEKPADAISAVTKVSATLGIFPKNLDLYSSGVTNADLNRKIDSYKIPRIDFYQDVGLDFSAKPRIEYVDQTVDPGKVKQYVNSESVSGAYDIFREDGANLSETDANNYTVDPVAGPYPLMRTNVEFGGSTYIPQGASVEVQWQGSSSPSGAWGSYNNGTWTAGRWTTSITDLKNRYVRFRVLMKPLSYDTPAIDDLKVTFWLYNAPYVLKNETNLPQNISALILTKLLTKNAGDLDKLNVYGEINDPGTYQLLNLEDYPNVLQIIPSGDEGIDATVKVEFLDDTVKLEDVTVDLFYTE